MEPSLNLHNITSTTRKIQLDSTVFFCVPSTAPSMPSEAQRNPDFEPGLPQVVCDFPTRRETVQTSSAPSPRMDSDTRGTRGGGGKGARLCLDWSFLAFTSYLQQISRIRGRPRGFRKPRRSQDMYSGEREETRARTRLDDLQCKKEELLQPRRWRDGQHGNAQGNSPQSDKNGGRGWSQSSFLSSEVRARIDKASVKRD
ncbi:hypothetical protein B0H17DRAFT_1056660 [Mycena rosella]|uniref:Uncharacterized protein n=1 Tax=Mycena rosella TaxID=1033263 RepID=A0AAD7GMU8_MYCRO|nr:hypothetical protein B0H17DRAFT_1056660 [Mycena rosella]